MPAIPHRVLSPHRNPRHFTGRKGTLTFHGGIQIELTRRRRCYSDSLALQDVVFDPPSEMLASASSDKCFILWGEPSNTAVPEAPVVPSWQKPKAS